MDQKQEFYERLHRSSQAQTKGPAKKGPAHTKNYARNQRIQEIMERNREDGISGSSIEPRLRLTQVASYILAFAMGALAAFIARFLRFQIAGTAEQLSTDMDLALDILFAIVVAFILREAVSLSAVKRMGAQVAGILIAIVTMHNVVHEMPSTFARLFSEQWVEHVLETTEPGTLYFRGHTYHI
ncbi:hypothetical protein [Celeribacter litoreus]|uniref:hypothetical protein n=1 Tax=Celeribacter litoreus TaxID=2876714 RepID=UPI001CCF7595|nr:hypothetical protein [Celeribacter litoreus]MCA0043884.1 hypothetical protein [Celeribacter litoreus]